MNMMPLYLTDLCSVLWMAALSFTLDVVPRNEFNPEVWRINLEVSKWLTWRISPFAEALQDFLCAQ